MRSRHFCWLLPILATCGAAACTESSTTAPQAGSNGDATTSPPDAATASDGGSGDGSALDASATDAGGGGDSATFDAGTLEAGMPGFCEAQAAGTPVIAMGATPAGGTSFYRVYPSGLYDQDWFHVTANGNDFQAADFAIHNGTLYLTNGNAWWSVPMAAVPASGTLDLSAPASFANSPPQVEYITTSHPFVARGGGTFYEINVGAGTWRTLGPLPAPGSTCSQRRDFVAGGAGNLYVLLATCTDTNSFVNVSLSETDAGFANATTLGTAPNPSAVLYAIPSVGVELSLSKIFANGTFVRNIAVCANNGLLIKPIGGLRSAQLL